MAVEDFSQVTGMTNRTRPETEEDRASARAQEAANFKYLNAAKPAATKPVSAGLASLGAKIHAQPMEADVAAADLSSPRLKAEKLSLDDGVSSKPAHKQPASIATAPAATDNTRDLADVLHVIPNRDIAHFRKLLNNDGGQLSPELQQSGLNAAEILKNALRVNDKLGAQVFHQGRQDPLGALDLNNDGKVTNYELAAHAIAFKADAEKRAPDSYLAKFAAKFGADKDHNDLAGKIYAAMKSQPQLEGVDPKEVHDFGEKAVNIPRPQGAPPSSRGK